MHSRPTGRFLTRSALAAAALALGACSLAPTRSDATSGAAPAATAASPRPVKVMIITLFAPEAQAWTKKLALDQGVAVPGLSKQFPLVRCTAEGICLMTTAMGHSNAAASTTALVLSNAFDLSKTYFLVTGIAGIDPDVGTIGSATWARYLVDFGLAHEFDARDMPAGWEAGYLGLQAKDPATKPELAYGTELFQLNEALLQRALTLSRTATLADTDTAKAYRALYAQTTAQAAPSVLQCDTVSGDTYLHGERLGRWATRWTALLTDGKGRYCSTQQEDNAVFEGLHRGALAGRVDLQRIAVLRTASNFDRPHPGQTAYESLKARSGGFPAATANLYNAGWPLVNEIVSHWSDWQAGVPPAQAAR